MVTPVKIVVPVKLLPSPDAARALGDELHGVNDGANRPIVFCDDAAQAYDRRNMGWDIDAQTVAITTMSGRLKGISFICSPEHCISKTIVTTAERTGHGISLEELKGIRERVRLRKPQRVALHRGA